MSRGLTNSFKDAMSGSVVYPALLAEFQFDDSTTRIWSGESNVSFNGETFVGGGSLVAVKFAGEGEQISAKQTVFTLNGVDQAYYSTAVNTQYRGRPAKLWWALLDSTSTTVLFSYLIEEARMDTLTVNETDNGITLQLSCESRLVDLFKPRRVFLNSTSHHKLYPNDDFYKFVPTLTDKLSWGMRVD